MCGDVMTGRGIDQVLPHPGNPAIFEPFMTSARGYVELAETATGPVPKPVSFSYIWGDALEELERAGPDARIINLETSVTRSGDHWPDKDIHYRMDPENVPCLTAAKIDCCALANNHVLDWGYEGLAETVATLKKAGIRSPGAGENRIEAGSPAIIDLKGKGRVLVFSCGSETSGITPEWAATENRPGVNFLEDYSDETVLRVGKEVRRFKRRGDAVVFSVHWGPNWGYDVSRKEREFARKLVSRAGVDVVHGHSSHHVKGIEVFRGKVILYGCGDFINDYEGIGGYEEFRADLSLMYFVRLDPAAGKLLSVRLVPMQMKHFRVQRASKTDAAWLGGLLNREGKEFDTRVELNKDAVLAVRGKDQRSPAPV
ncbi:MAG: CapA family protein [Endomicrobiales bacterium]